MPNQVTDVHVRRVSFVKRASTRDPLSPDQPRRVLLYKAEGASDRDTSIVTPPARYVETAADREARRLSKLLDEMHHEIEVMRGDGSPPAVIHAHERAYGRVHVQLVALHDPAAARVLRDGADGDKPHDEREDKMTPAELYKRAIGSDGAKPAATHGLLTLQEIEDRQARMTPVLSGLHHDLRRMHRTPETPPHVVERHQRAFDALGTEYRALDQQRGLAEAAQAQSLRDGEPSVLAKADELRKADHTLSAAEAFRRAMRDPQVQAAYWAQAGTAAPVAPTRTLAKSAGDTFAEHHASVERLAAQLEKSQGLRPTAAYRRALSESGAYTAAAA